MMMSSSFLSNYEWLLPYIGAYEHEHKSGLTGTKAIAIGTWVCFWYIIHWLSPLMGRALYKKKHYESMKHECDARVVALLHALMASWGGIITMYLTYSHWNTPEQRIFGGHPITSIPMTVSMGYFLWDVLFSLSNPALFGFEFVFHAIMALVVFSVPHFAMLNYYVVVCLLLELSTPYIHIHWFLEMLPNPSKLLILINDATLAFYFIIFRIIYGPYEAYNSIVESLHFYRMGEFTSIQAIQITGTLSAVVLLCVLNFYWFVTLILPGIAQVFCGSGKVPQMKKD